jgi:hypothetical protein
MVSNSAVDLRGFFKEMDVLEAPNNVQVGNHEFSFIVKTRTEGEVSRW